MVCVLQINPSRDETKRNETNVVAAAAASRRVACWSFSYVFFSRTLSAGVR